MASKENKALRTGDVAEKGLFVDDNRGVVADGVVGLVVERNAAWRAAADWRRVLDSPRNTIKNKYNATRKRVAYV